jgi:anti-anti-sigma regulatory factor
MGELNRVAFERLQRALGPKEGSRLGQTTLRALRLQEITSAQDLLHFAELLMRHGGASETVGRSLKAVALLRGASESKDVLELASLVEALQTLVNEVSLDKLVERILRIVATNADALRATLVLHNNGTLRIAACHEAESDTSTSGLASPLEEGDTLPVLVVRHVASTKESLILRDPSADPRFREEVYFSTRSPQGILCLPMLHQTRLIGVLYLEGRTALTSLSSFRVEFLGLLCAQAAVAVENAMLLAAQQARVQELSTPVIPITDHIMVMPIIGTMDSTRAEGMLQTVLQGAAENRASVMIVDITGMKMVDGAAIATLLRLASALRLLGMQTIVTGITPAVAQTIVARTLDVGAIKTFGSLKRGIRYALKRTSGMNVRA